MNRYYIFIENGKINGGGECRQLTEGVVNFEVSEEVYNSVLECQEKYIYQDGQIVENPDYEQILRDREKARIMSLSMTPLDFLKALEVYAGVTYDQIKQLCDSNPIIDRELRFCQNVYRNNELLVEQIGTFGITEEMLDKIFVEVDKIKNSIDL